MTANPLLDLPRHRFAYEPTLSRFVCIPPTGPGRPADRCQGCGTVVTDEELVRLVPAASPYATIAGDLELNLAVLLRELDR